MLAGLVCFLASLGDLSVCILQSLLDSGCLSLCLSTIGVRLHRELPQSTISFGQLGTLSCNVMLMGLPFGFPLLLPRRHFGTQRAFTGLRVLNHCLDLVAVILIRKGL